MGEGGRIHLPLAFGHLTINYISFSRRSTIPSTVPTPDRDTSNIGLSFRFSISYIKNGRGVSGHVSMGEGEGTFSVQSHL